MHDEQEQQKVSQLTTQYVTGRQLSKGPICLKEPFQDGAHHAEVVHKKLVATSSFAMILQIQVSLALVLCSIVVVLLKLVIVIFNFFAYENKWE